MKKRINVKNRSAGNVVYTVPDLKVRRDFLPGEVKMVDVDELNQLSYHSYFTSIKKKSYCSLST